MCILLRMYELCDMIHTHDNYSALCAAFLEKEEAIVINLSNLHFDSNVGILL